MYSVYCHIFPNGKKYIGISKDPKKRWGYNGEHYNTQKKVARAIKKYGWENVKHIILADGLTKEEAEAEEIRLIAENDSINNGYNISIGGGKINSTYLNPYVLSMIRAAKRYFPEIDGLWLIAENEKFNEEWSGYWNEADRGIAIKRKQITPRKLSPTDMFDVSEYWKEQGIYLAYYTKVRQLEKEVAKFGGTITWGTENK